MTDAQIVQLVFGSSVLAALLGWALNALAQQRRDFRIGKSAKYALQAELDNAAAFAAAYLKPGAVKRVGGRASTLLYQEAAPTLLRLGYLDASTIQPLIAVYGTIESFNRSLDQIEDHNTEGRAERAAKEVQRAELKAMQIASAEALRMLMANPEVVPGILARIEEKLRKGNGRTHYDRARAALGFL